MWAGQIKFPGPVGRASPTLKGSGLPLWRQMSIVEAAVVASNVDRRDCRCGVECRSSRLPFFFFFFFFFINIFKGLHTCPSLWPSDIGSRLGQNRLWVRFLAVSDIYPMFIEPTITWALSGISGYIWREIFVIRLVKFMMRKVIDNR